MLFVVCCVLCVVRVCVCARANEHECCVMCVVCCVCVVCVSEYL